MNKNYRVQEALEVLKSRKNKEAVIDITKRFPLFATASFEEIINALPDEITLKKLEGYLRGGIEITNSGEEEEVIDLPLNKETKDTKKKDQVKGQQEFDFDDDEEIEKPKKKSKEKEEPKASKKTKSKPKVEEDNDDDFDVDFDSDDEDEDDEEEEVKPKSKDKEKNKPSRDEDDFDF